MDPSVKAPHRRNTDKRICANQPHTVGSVKIFLSTAKHIRDKIDNANHSPLLAAVVVLQPPTNLPGFHP
jgi:hypothetical protein